MTLDISGLVHFKVIVGLLRLRSFLYMIAIFTLSNSHIDLFLASFTLPDSIQVKIDSLSLTKLNSFSPTQVI